MNKLVLSLQVTAEADRAKARLDRQPLDKPVIVRIYGIEYVAEVLDYELKEC